MNREFVLPELLPLVTGRPGAERVYPFGRSTIDRDVKVVCRRIGLPPRSPHDLRRSFGRIAYGAGVPLNVIQGIYGHADLAETSYYIGVDQTEQRAGIDLFSRLFQVPGSEAFAPEPAARQLPDAPARS
jgi:integrase